MIRGVDEIGPIEYWAARVEGRDNILDVTVTGAAVDRLGERLSGRRQVMMTASCGLCGRLHHRVAARARLVGGGRVDRAGRRDRRAARSRCGRRRRCLTPPAGCMRRGCSTARAGCCWRRRTWAATTRWTRSSAARCVEGRHPLDAALLLVSGRTSFELVQKALLAGIPLIAAVSAPSSLAIDLAEESGITLCGFVRGGSFNIYSHPRRVVG